MNRLLGSRTTFATSWEVRDSPVRRGQTESVRAPLEERGKVDLFDGLAVMRPDRIDEPRPFDEC